MKKSLILFIGLGMLMIFSGQVYAAPIVDVVEAPTGYFVPTDAQKGDSPYYRWWDDDWGWTHTAIPGTFSTAELSISAFDVDYPYGEVDIIYAYDTDTTTWIELGYLEGEDEQWSYKTFDLNLSIFGNEINNGLEVWIDIDTTHTSNYWAVTLAKSVLNLDGGTIPGPGPGAQVPEPATFLLFGFGLAGLAGLKKRFK